MGVSLPDMEEESSDSDNINESINESANEITVVNGKEKINDQYSSVNIKLTKYEVTP
jgi:hypothetical protein